MVCLPLVVATVALTPTNTNQGYPSLQLPPPYMNIPPAFYSRGFAVPQPPILPPQAQRFPSAHHTEG